MIAFLDFPPKTYFLPMAAELNDGHVVTFFEPLIAKLRSAEGDRPIVYPDDSLDGFEELRES
jgi:hypothetical protein